MSIAIRVDRVGKTFALGAGRSVEALADVSIEIWGGEFVALIADFVLEAGAPNATAPNVRRTVQMRLVCSRDANRWKIVDISPRSLFE